VRSPVDGSSTKKNLNTGDLVATLAVTRLLDLTDEQWARLEPLLPVPTRSGRPSEWTKRQLIDGIQLPRKPRLPAPTRHRLHHSRTSRPTTTPQEPRPQRRPPSQVQPGRLPSPGRRRMRNQPTQPPPRRRHQIRQTRRPIRSHPPHRRHQRLAPDLTLRQAPGRAFADGNTDSVAKLAADLLGPVGLELARAVEQLPGPHGMPGGPRFGLKWDGFLH